VGWTCGTHGGGERCLQGFGSDWEDLGVGGQFKSLFIYNLAVIYIKTDTKP